MTAAYKNEHAVVQELFFDEDGTAREEVDVNLQDEQNDTALTIAASTALSCPDVVRELLKRKDLDVNMEGSRNQSALCKAVSGKNSGVVEELLSREDLDLKGAHQNSALWCLVEAAGRGDFQVVKVLLTRKDLAVNQPGN